MKHEKYSCPRENPERAVFFLDKRSWYLRLFPEGGDRANLLFPQHNVLLPCNARGVSRYLLQYCRFI